MQHDENPMGMLRISQVRIMPVPASYDRGKEYFVKYTLGTREFTSSCQQSEEESQQKPVVSCNNLILENVDYSPESNVVITVYKGNIQSETADVLKDDVEVGIANAGYNMWTIGIDASEDKLLPITTDDGVKVGEISLRINLIKQPEVGILEFRLNSAHDLRGPELLNLNDCYVVFTFEKRRMRSTVKYGTTKPVWNEKYDLDNVMYPPPTKAAITVVYKNHPTDKVLGVASCGTDLWSIGTEE